MRGGKREGSGRKQGTSNKYNLRELFEDNNFDVGTKIIEMLEDEGTDKRTKLELIKLVFPYVFSKPQTFNISLESNNNEINNIIKELMLSDGIQKTSEN